MSLPKVHSVILSGGFGNRLWPTLRNSMPKQFVRFGEDASLLQQAIRPQGRHQLRHAGLADCL